VNVTARRIVFRTIRLPHNVQEQGAIIKGKSYASNRRARAGYTGRLLMMCMHTHSVCV
jgi:hypothetical protein